MLEGLYNLATPWARANGMQITKNRLLGLVANYIYPLYCKTSKLRTISNNSLEVIVSLTSFPRRINQVHLCIQSILRQKRPADKVILWLASSQFPNDSCLPKELIKLIRYGLEIKYCKDIRSYKKIFYTAQEYADKIIVTADDDTLYPENWLSSLLNEHEQYPDCVICHRAHLIQYINGGFAPYSEWKGLSVGVKGPDINLIPIGVGGVLYPRNYFEDVVFDEKLITSICPTADDLWLKVIGFKKKIKVVKVAEDSKEWFTIRNSQEERLTDYNVGQNKNDDEFKELVNYYKINANEFCNK